MRFWLPMVVLFMGSSVGQAADAAKDAEAQAFVRQVVQSLMDGGTTITFAVADKVSAIDNGEVLSKEEFSKAWPKLAKVAFKRRVSLDEFFRDVTVQFTSPLDNKRLMSNKKVLAVYTPRQGDLYCDASRVKEGTENFIAYEKAFVFIIRKIEGKWTLIGMGG